MPRLRTADPVSYRVLVGMDYHGTRREPGEVVDDIPAESRLWLLAQNIIEPVTANVEEVMSADGD